MLESITPTGSDSVNVEALSSSPSPAPLEDLSVTHIRKHHSEVNSVAGGDVILGGFAAALVAAIICYIRITRRSSKTSLTPAETCSVK